MRSDADFAHIQVLDGHAVSALSTEPNSSKYAIDAHNRSIQELGNLSELSKLYSLDVSFNKIASLRNVSTAKALKELKIYSNKLTNTLGLKTNSNLEDLQMNDNHIEKISSDFLALRKLRYLRLNNNKIERIRNLRGCKLLVHLDLGRNMLHGVASEGLDALINLEYLNLAGNKLTSMGNFVHLTKLEELDLSDNNLTAFQGTMPANLVILRVNANQIANFEGLVAPLDKLNELYAHDNVIQDLKALSVRCPQLESVDLRNNQIKSSSEIAVLANCKALQDIWLDGNPCCSLSSYFVDVMTALPGLKTLDALTDTQLNICVEKLRGSGSKQDELLISSRASTPSHRPGSAASQPNSARGRFALGRPATPNTPPVFLTPSIGYRIKVIDTDELSRAREEVNCRLQKMKQLLTRAASTPDMTIVSNDRPIVMEHVSRVEPTHQSPSARADLIPAAIASTDVEARLPEVDNATKLTSSVTLPVSGALKSSRNPKFVPRVRTVQSLLIRRSCVDAGTDPLESLVRSRDSIVGNTSTSGCEMESQTSTPPAPILSVSKSGSVSSLGRIFTAEVENQQHEIINERHTSVEGQQDGQSIETEMKQFLLQHVLESSDDNQNIVRETTEKDIDVAALWSESPQLHVEHIKTAELRTPPALLARKGYRSFRMPSRPSSSRSTWHEKSSMLK